MTRIIVDPQTRDKLSKLLDPVELCMVRVVHVWRYDTPQT